MEQQVGRQVRQKSPEQALQALMRLCARAEKSSGDARRLMRRWGLENKTIESVLAQLKHQRFIDDRRYAEAFVREKSRLSGWGAYKIRAALQRKEVPQEVIIEALASINCEQNREMLLRQLTRKARTVKAATSYEYRSKLLRYGLSLGHSYEAVSDVVSQLIQTEDHSCEDFFE